MVGCSASTSAAMCAAAYSRCGSTVAFAIRKSCALLEGQSLNACNDATIPLSNNVLSVLMMVSRPSIVGVIVPRLSLVFLLAAMPLISRMAAFVSWWSSKAARWKGSGRCGLGFGVIGVGIIIFAVVIVVVVGVVDSDDIERGVLIVP